jgi:hypothetical protein
MSGYEKRNFQRKVRNAESLDEIKEIIEELLDYFSEDSRDDD